MTPTVKRIVLQSEPHPYAVPAYYPAGSRMGLNTGAPSSAPWSIRRRMVNGSVALSSLIVRLPNWWVSDHLAENVTANAIRIRCSIEYPKGTTPVHFTKGGDTYMVVEPGETLQSDPMAKALPANADFYLHLYIAAWDGEAEISGEIPNGRSVTQQGGTVNDDQYTNSSATDMTGTIGGETTAYTGTGTRYDVAFVGGIPVDPTAKSFVVIGDSITQRDFSTGSDAKSNQGMWARWLTGVGGYGLMNLGKAASEAADWVKLPRRQMPRVEAMLDNVGSHVIVMLGTNDMPASGGTAADHVAPLRNVQELVSWLAVSKRRRVYFGTLPPRSGSTDSWATVENQTPSGSTTLWPSRIAFNKHVRAGMPHVAGYIEIADTLESARDAGTWKAGLTEDGLHPDIQGCAAVASAGLPIPR
jgi:lysophospholipase L1-like esterase